MKRAFRTIGIGLMYVHLYSAYLSILFLPVLLAAVILKGSSLNEDALWIRAGYALFRIHACMWRGIVFGFLVALVLFIPSRVVTGIRNRGLYMDSADLSLMAMRIPAAVGCAVMLALASIRFFQLPFPTPFLRDPALYEFWRELITYPKTNFLSAAAGILAPCVFYTRVMKLQDAVIGRILEKHGLLD